MTSAPAVPVSTSAPVVPTIVHSSSLTIVTMPSPSATPTGAVTGGTMRMANVSSGSASRSPRTEMGTFWLRAPVGVKDTDATRAV